MINTQNFGYKELKLILPNTNKALAEVLKSATPQQMQTLSQEKTLESLLQNIFQETLQNNTQDKTLLKLLQNNPTFKSLSNMQESLKSLHVSIPKETQLHQTLSSFLQNIEKIAPDELQNKLENSGILLESKLKNEQEIQNDLKALLLKAQNEITDPKILKHIDKILLQIDYYQLSSYLANAQTLFIPYSWDLLEDGHLSIKQTKNEENICDIELTLKEYGSLKIRLGLFEKNQLYITLNAQSKELKTLLEENIDILKKQLINTNLIPKSISFVEEKKSTYNTPEKELRCGFEVNV
jgi:hypothetical protein